MQAQSQHAMHMVASLIPRPCQKLGKGPGVTCKDSRMCCVSSLRLEQRNHIRRLPIIIFLRSLALDKRNESMMQQCDYQDMQDELCNMLTRHIQKFLQGHKAPFPIFWVWPGDEAIYMWLPWLTVSTNQHHTAALEQVIACKKKKRCFVHRCVATVAVAHKSGKEFKQNHCSKHQHYHGMNTVYRDVVTYDAIEILQLSREVF